jgi:hypothetical protein
VNVADKSSEFKLTSRWTEALGKVWRRPCQLFQVPCAAPWYEFLWIGQSALYKVDRVSKIRDLNGFGRTSLVGSDIGCERMM